MLPVRKSIDCKIMFETESCDPSEVSIERPFVVKLLDGRRKQHWRAGSVIWNATVNFLRRKHTLNLKIEFVFKGKN